MNIADYYTWFHQYYHRFYSDDPTIMGMVEYKEKHSLRVAKNAKDLATSLGLPPSKIDFAELAGLFHDIARAEQAHSGTFQDSPAFDHGDVGEDRLQEENILRALPPEDQEILLFAVKYHNKRLVPPVSHEKTLFTNIVRDADKLDIFRMLPPVQADHDYSPVLIDYLLQEQVAPYEKVRTQADKRLIRIGWFYDINYVWTLSRLLEEGHADQLLAPLPDTPICTQIKKTLQNYLQRKMKSL